MRSKSWPLLGLALLTLVTAVLVVLALLHVRPRDMVAVPADPASPAAPSAPNQAATADPTASPAGGGTPRPRTAEGAKEVMRGDEVDVVVLGDASGAGAKGWVAQLSDALAKSRKVKLVTVAGQSDSTRELGSGARTVTVRNVADDTLTLRTAASRATELIPEGTDLVIVNFGHRETQGSISADLDALWGKIPPSSSAVVIVQNPQKGPAQQAQRERARAVSDWATENKAPKVDVFDAFLKAPEPLAELLQKDQVLPNEDGARIYRDAVVKMLGA